LYAGLRHRQTAQTYRHVSKLQKVTHWSVFLSFFIIFYTFMNLFSLTVIVIVASWAHPTSTRDLRRTLRTNSEARTFDILFEVF
jgi:hypothetical protein